MVSSFNQGMGDASTRTAVISATRSSTVIAFDRPTQTPGAAAFWVAISTPPLLVLPNKMFSAPAWALPAGMRYAHTFRQWCDQGPTPTNLPSLLEWAPPRGSIKDLCVQHRGLIIQVPERVQWLSSLVCTLGEHFTSDSLDSRSVSFFL